jgi:5-formyltetrahydrofolate cyclo-ligase
VKSWDEVREWRRAMRADLLAKRAAVPRAERQRVREMLGNALLSEFPELRSAVIGFYWPFKSEIDVNTLVQELVAAGAEAALPVVVEKQQPLEFWRWHPHMKLMRGLWNIPVPAERNVLQPTALIVPLLGFDSAGYRLGYGGGYYDRTLATMTPRPLTVGVGYELGRLDTIYPQAHDIPLDAIVTEAGTARHRLRGLPLNDSGSKPEPIKASR